MGVAYILMIVHF